MDKVENTPVVSDAERAHYAAHGYLLLESFVSDDWLDRLKAASDEFVEQSRTLTASTRVLDLEPDHTTERPRLRRLTAPVDHHSTFREFALHGPAAQVATALLGSPARFHHSKLNYKWAHGGQAVEWHQDIQFWPHTDFTPLTIGVYLCDVDDEMGPMGVLSGSHLGPLHDLYDDNDEWSGSLSPATVESLDLDMVSWLPGPAGSVTVHNCAAVHGSPPNNSPNVRPLLLQTYSAVDSFPLVGVGATGMTGRHTGTLVGEGPGPRWLTVEGRTMPAAPDWSRGGYTTIFDSQDQVLGDG